MEYWQTKNININAKLKIFVLHKSNRCYINLVNIFIHPNVGNLIFQNGERIEGKFQLQKLGTYQLLEDIQ